MATYPCVRRSRYWRPATESCCELAGSLVESFSTPSRAALRAAAGPAAAFGPPAPPDFVLRAGGHGPAG
jgi:hypothetical protein